MLPIFKTFTFTTFACDSTFSLHLSFASYLLKWSERMMLLLVLAEMVSVLSGWQRWCPCCLDDSLPETGDSLMAGSGPGSSLPGQPGVSRPGPARAARIQPGVAAQNPDRWSSLRGQDKIFQIPPECWENSWLLGLIKREAGGDTWGPWSPPIHSVLCHGGAITFKLLIPNFELYLDTQSRKCWSPSF